VNFNPAFPYEEAMQKRKWYLPRCMPMSLPQDVGLLPANIWGLHDMHGNVWEFTDNYWTDSHEGAPRDGGPGSKIRVRRIVVKGGSYFDSAIKARSAARMPRVIDELDVNLGVRLSATSRSIVRFNGRCRSPLPRGGRSPLPGAGRSPAGDPGAVGHVPPFPRRCPWRPSPVLFVV
jgi:hypothetical protein